MNAPAHRISSLGLLWIMVGLWILQAYLLFRDDSITAGILVVLIPIMMIGLFVYLTTRDLRRLTWQLHAAEGFCIECGYDLRATPMRCPECGAQADEE